MGSSTFDMTSDEFAAHPEPFFDAMRKECPVWQDERSGIYRPMGGVPRLNHLLLRFRSPEQVTRRAVVS